MKWLEVFEEFFIWEREREGHSTHHPLQLNVKHNNKNKWQTSWTSHTKESQGDLSCSLLLFTPLIHSLFFKLKHKRQQTNTNDNSHNHTHPTHLLQHHPPSFVTLLIIKPLKQTLFLFIFLHTHHQHPPRSPHTLRSSFSSLTSCRITNTHWRRERSIERIKLKFQKSSPLFILQFLIGRVHSDAWRVWEMSLMLWGWDTQRGSVICDFDCEMGNFQKSLKGPIHCRDERREVVKWRLNGGCLWERWFCVFEGALHSLHIKLDFLVSTSPTHHLWSNKPLGSLLLSLEIIFLS